MKKPIYDLHRMSEDQRIALICHQVIEHNATVNVLLENDQEKRNRWIAKVKAIIPNVTVGVFPGPTAIICQVLFGPPVFEGVPATKEEYDAAYQKGVVLFGEGVDTGMTVPCPCCLASGFMSYKVLEVEKEMQKEVVCPRCGFGTKSVVQRTPFGVSFVTYQTKGPNVPAYLPQLPKWNEVSKSSNN